MDRRTHSPTYTLYKHDIDTVKAQFHCTYAVFNLDKTRLCYTFLLSHPWPLLSF